MLVASALPFAKFFQDFPFLFISKAHLAITTNRSKPGD